MRRNIGLSPRLRGNPCQFHLVGELAGSIPAPAGEPTSLTLLGAGPTVYPRACGGTSSCSRCSPWMRGLSPRLRGNHALQVLVESLERSIPAPAGEPTTRRIRRSPSSVYPRACGGTIHSWSRGGISAGLSPRLRGNLPEDPRALGSVGSIPAPAGEPLDVHPGQCQLGVYPRACGGTFWNQTPDEVSKGLSPRLRGNQFQL